MMNQQDNRLAGNQSIVSEGILKDVNGKASESVREDLGVPNADIIKGGNTRLAGRRGGSSTVTDDVVVDGRIITAENYD